MAEATSSISLTLWYIPTSVTQGQSRLAMMKGLNIYGTYLDGVFLSLPVKGKLKTTAHLKRELSGDKIIVYLENENPTQSSVEQNNLSIETTVKKDWCEDELDLWEKLLPIARMCDDAVLLKHLRYITTILNVAPTEMIKTFSESFSQLPDNKDAYNVGEPGEKNSEAVVKLIAGLWGTDPHFATSSFLTNAPTAPV